MHLCINRKHDGIFHNTCTLQCFPKEAFLHCSLENSGHWSMASLCLASTENITSVTISASATGLRVRPQCKRATELLPAECRHCFQTCKIPDAFSYYVLPMLGNTWLILLCLVWHCWAQFGSAWVVLSSHSAKVNFSVYIYMFIQAFWVFFSKLLLTSLYILPY